ncbi:MAG TPA: DUF3482 domain-containing protein [Usitatibacter sp.]|nr:DUF3482 domain-containing protein [Usitatibacter sp.]
MSVNLTVAAHTNVGKTTLVRTLLKRDIGEVADRAHVTETAERHTLLDTEAGDALYLWDTPGFGDSARLLKRLRNSGNPIGWLQTQVWDRWVDRPFYCSQQAVRNVRDEGDVVLYLVNAAEDPAAAAYVEAELQILQWIGKPVLLLLNQAGPPRSREAEAADEARWSRQLALHVRDRSVITLDAFARCWVQEDRLLREAGSLLPPQKQEELTRLRAAWRARNLATFDASMRVLAEHLAAVALDVEVVPEKLDPAAFLQRARHWLSRARGEKGEERAVEAAMASLASRLDARLRESTDKLIALHGLAGRAQQRILERTAGQFEVATPADVAGTGLVGGVLTGAAGGLAADLSAGGLTLGAGMLIGALLGALGAGGAARAYNLIQGQQDGRVRWSPEFLTRQASAALLRYLAVAHYGRGRGDWTEGEAPPHWQPLVEEAVRAHEPALRAAWSLADKPGTVPDLPKPGTVPELGAEDRGLSPVRGLQRELAQAARELLQRLYPEAREIFAEQGSAGPA